MSLKKGFLKPKITLEVLNLDRRKLAFGIVLWLALSFSIYSILYGLRESLRYTSFWWNGEDFLILTPKENYFYNFFFAFLASTFAFAAISSQWIRRSSTLRNIPQYKKSAIFHDKVSFTSYFTYWFGKMGAIFWLVSCAMGVFSEFSLFPDYILMFILILLNLFLHQWLNLRLLFKNSILVWMIGSLGAITLVSFLFAGVNLISYRDLNESVLKKTMGYHLAIKLPALVNSKPFLKPSLTTNIYVGFSKKKPDSIPHIVVRDFYDPINYISIDKLEAFIKKERAMANEYEKDQLVWRLSIDKQVKMKYVKELKNELNRNGARHIQYASANNQSNDFSSRYLGLLHTLIDPKSDYSKFLLGEKNKVIAKLRIRENQISINDSIISTNGIRKIAGDLLLANGGSGIIELEVDNESTYEVYIRVCDQLVGTIRNLRDEWALKNFRTHYSGVESYDSAQQHIDDLAREQFSLGVVEKD